MASLSVFFVSDGIGFGKESLVCTELENAIVSALAANAIDCAEANLFLSSSANSFTLLAGGELLRAILKASSIIGCCSPHETLTGASCRNNYRSY